MNSSILISEQDGICLLTFNRPEKKNALTQAMYGDLSQALLAASRNSAVKVVVFSGGDHLFTSGNDIQEFLGSPDALEQVLKFLQIVAAFEKPLVAAVNGAAVGIGTTLLLHCDLVYCAENAHFQMPFVLLGLCPEAGSTLLLPRLVGTHKANELLLLGNPFDANAALSCGIVNQILPEEKVLSHTLEIAKHLAKLPHEAVCATKKLLKSNMQKPIEEVLEEEAKIFRGRLFSEEAREQFKKFLHK